MLGVRLTVSDHATPCWAASRLRSGNYTWRGVAPAQPSLVDWCAGRGGRAGAHRHPDRRQHVRPHLVPAPGARGRAPRRSARCRHRRGRRRHARGDEPDLERHVRQLLAAAHHGRRRARRSRSGARASATPRRGGTERSRRRAAPAPLLAEAARITDGAADIDEALRRLVEMLVPGHRRRRVDRRASGPTAWRAGSPRASTDPTREELEAWLMDRGAAAARRALPDHALAARRGLAARRARPSRCATAMIHDEEDRRHMSSCRGCAGRWRCRSRRAAGRSGRSGSASGAPAAATAPRSWRSPSCWSAARGLALANAQLVGRLTAAQRRLDGILGSLAEAVTVQDAQRPDGVREPGGGAPARAARRARRAHRTAGRPRRPVRDPPPRRPARRAGRAARLPRDARARRRRRCSPRASTRRPASCTGSSPRPRRSRTRPASCSRST